MKRKKASALPKTCGECEHGVLSLPPPHLRCGRDRVLDRGVEADKAPPAWCPLRNRPKKLERSRTGTVLLFAVGRRCAAHWPLDEAFDPRLVEKRCTLPCQAIGRTSPHPRPCFCGDCRPQTPRREWRPSW